MNWGRWKRGLVIATLTGLLSEVVLIVLDPQVPWRVLIGMLIYGAAKDALLWLRSHPEETIKDDDKK